jgi:hypothetical protein
MVFCQNPSGKLQWLGTNPHRNVKQPLSFSLPGFPPPQKNEKLKASSYADTTVFVYCLLPICSPEYKCNYNRPLQLAALSDACLQTVEITEN